MRQGRANFKQMSDAALLDPRFQYPKYLAMTKPAIMVK